MQRTFQQRTLIAIMAIGLIFLAGCHQPALQEQVNLSRPGMLFSESATTPGTVSLVTTLEPGSDDSAGAASSTCTVCR